MVSVFSPRRSRRARWLLTASLVVALGPWAAAQEKPADGNRTENGAAPAAVVAAPAATLDLATCRRLALENQPSIAAAVASLAAAEARSAGLENQRGIPLVTRDLSVRRQQAGLGVAIAQAQVELTRQETLYNVTRTYWTAVFARQQTRTADDIIATLRQRKKDVDELEKHWSKDTVAALLLVAQGRREAGVQGHQRALAALREAMGVGADYPCFDVADAELPRPPAAAPCCDEIVRLALARRSELVQASLFADITHHEVKAQAAKFLHPTVKTFASGSDVHARLVPQGSHDGEYRPGGLVPEMPTLLVGSRSSRLEQARAYSARAGSLVDKTRNLITLEAQDACLRLQEDLRKLPQFEAAAAAAKRAADTTAQDARKPLETNVTQSDAIQAGLLSTQFRLQVNETLFQIVLDLAALERITAGGYCP